MAIISNEQFNTEDIYLDYSFEEVMFRWDHNTKKVFRKFYGENEYLNSVPSSNRLFNDAIRFGVEITYEQYIKGKEKI
jgi:hypothetical protein